MESLKQYQLRIGDKLVEAIFPTGITKHFAVYLGFWNGQDWIAENHHNSNGVQIMNAYDYLKSERNIVRVDKFEGSETERKQVVARAVQLTSKPYHLVQYNCEHFVTEASTGRSGSRQVQNFICAALLLIFIGLLTSD